MFRKIQSFVTDCCHAILVPSDRVLDDGVVEHGFVEASSIVLPAAENYSLDVLLKAGVNLQQVNCKLIQSSRASVVLPSDESTPNDVTKEN